MTRMKKTLAAVLGFGAIGAILSIALVTNAVAQPDGPEASSEDHPSYGYGACSVCSCNSYSGRGSACAWSSCRHRFTQHKD